MRRKIKRPPRLGLPLIVKSLSEDASYGIAQASVVDSDEKLAERVTFIHERIGTAAIAEQYIEGRELYVGVLGNDRLRVLPIWELEFGNDDARRAAASPPRRSSTISSTRSATASMSGRPRTSRRNWSPASSASPSASTGRWSSTAMPASISASPPTASPITSRPTPIPRSPGSRNSPRPPCTTGSNIPTCCSGSWRSASAGPDRPASARKADWFGPRRRPWTISQSSWMAGPCHGQSVAM